MWIKTTRGNDFIEVKKIFYYGSDKDCNEYIKICRLSSVVEVIQLTHTT